MHVVGFAGYSGSGKTTLIERLVGCLGAAGQRVSVIKHAHHGFEIDRPGKDSWRHRKAGAHEVLVASPRLLALQRETPVPTEYRVVDLLNLLETVDWVLVEGYKQEPIPKIEVWRESYDKPVWYPGDPLVRAIATDAHSRLPEATTLQRLDLDDPQGVTAWMLGHASLFDVSNITGS